LRGARANLLPGLILQVTALIVGVSEQTRALYQNIVASK